MSTLVLYHHFPTRTKHTSRLAIIHNFRTESSHQVPFPCQIYTRDQKFLHLVNEGKWTGRVNLVNLSYNYHSDQTKAFKMLRSISPIPYHYRDKNCNVMVQVFISWVSRLRVQNKVTVPGCNKACKRWHCTTWWHFPQHQVLISTSDKIPQAIHTSKLLSQK